MVERIRKLNNSGELMFEKATAEKPPWLGHHLRRARLSGNGVSSCQPRPSIWTSSQTSLQKVSALSLPYENLTQAVGGGRIFCLPQKADSNQPQPLQAGMPVLADDDVVVDGNPQRLRDLDDRLRHRDVGLRRRRIAGRMVVHQPTETVTTLIYLNVSNILDE